MKFTRTERYDPFCWTPRKEAIATKRPERVAAALKAALPLLAELLPLPTPFDAQSDKAKRQAALDRAEKSRRDGNARVWRTSRRDYFRATPSQQAEIRDGWDKWTGPTTALYFRYMVDLHTGVMDERSKRFQQRECEMLSRLKQRRLAQPALF